MNTNTPNAAEWFQFQMDVIVEHNGETTLEFASQSQRERQEIVTLRTFRKFRQTKYTQTITCGSQSFTTPEHAAEFGALLAYVAQRAAFFLPQ